MAAVSVEGVVREILPRALYRVEIDGGREVVAHAGAGVKRNFIRLLVGDRVAVELMSRDVSRGRVVKKIGS
ncbi:MAG: translation initiation factor IF-1 [Acidobacteriota bacterium]